jgi:peptidoglycan/xylan/chitin deacetylase (PgdA/CDA1 family)
MSAVRTYREFTHHWSQRTRLRSMARDAAVSALGLRRSVARSAGWVAFPYYHHVFDDERAGFARQLKYMRNFGEFLDLDSVAALMATGQRIDGRYFCLTFDDGFRNVFTNALPILADAGARAAIFLPTSFMVGAESDRTPRYDFFDHGQVNIEFLNWDEVRALKSAGTIIGSHTVHHARLADISLAEAEQELTGSKLEIERETGGPCDHFCSPFGIPGRDFRMHEHPQLAKKLGYRSFSTTQRGLNRVEDPSLILNRDHMLANWGPAQIRYFFGAR